MSIYLASVWKYPAKPEEQYYCSFYNARHAWAFLAAQIAKKWYDWERTYNKPSGEVAALFNEYGLDVLFTEILQQPIFNESFARNLFYGANPDAVNALVRANNDTVSSYTVSEIRYIS